MRFIRTIILLLSLFAIAHAAASAQFGTPRQSTDPLDIKRQKEREKSLNQDRVKEIKKDTDDLLHLATELKSSVDAAGENTLSLEVIRKTDEIEKLAKKVRGKMKETYSTPATNPLPDATSR